MSCSISAFYQGPVIWKSRGRAGDECSLWCPPCWKGSVWRRTALKTIYPSPLTCSKSILLSREANQDPEPLRGAPQLDGGGGGVVGLLSLKLGQALWVLATDLGAWDPLGWRCSVRRSKHALSPCSALQLSHVPPQIPKSLLGCRERSVPWVESWSQAIPQGQMLRACPGMRDTAGSTPCPLGCPHVTPQW